MAQQPHSRRGQPRPGCDGGGATSTNKLGENSDEDSPRRGLRHRRGAAAPCPSRERGEGAAEANMLYCGSSSPATSSFVPSLALSTQQSRRLHKSIFHRRPSRRRSFPAASLNVGVEEVAELAQNKVLISATLACAIGQLSKPFTSALSGDGLDLWAAIRAGGMPSSHSAGVMAVTTCLGLERGFSDPIFGMSAVFAAFVMYDAQGVRREVGNHAKVLNRIRKQQGSSLFLEKDNSVDSTATVNVNRRSLAPFFSSSDNTNSYMPEQGSFPISTPGKASNEFGPSTSATTIDGDDSSEKAKYIYSPLNESVGHTEIQVIVGALLGFVVSLAIEAIA